MFSGVTASQQLRASFGQTYANMPLRIALVCSNLQQEQRVYAVFATTDATGSLAVAVDIPIESLSVALMAFVNGNVISGSGSLSGVGGFVVNGVQPMGPPPVVGRKSLVTGQVFNADGTPAVAEQVTAQVSYQSGTVGTGTGVTGADGSFSIPTSADLFLPGDMIVSGVAQVANAAIQGQLLGSTVFTAVVKAAAKAAAPTTNSTITCSVIFDNGQTATAGILINFSVSFTDGSVVRVQGVTDKSGKVSLPVTLTPTQLNSSVVVPSKSTALATPGTDWPTQQLGFGQTGTNPNTTITFTTVIVKAPFGASIGLPSSPFQSINPSTGGLPTSDPAYQYTPYVTAPNVNQNYIPDPYSNPYW